MMEEQAVFSHRLSIDILFDGKGCLMGPGWPIMKSHMSLNITGLFSWASCSVVMACLDVKCIPHLFILVLTVSVATIAFLVSLRWSKHLNESFPSAGMPHKWYYCFWNPMSTSVHPTTASALLEVSWFLGWCFSGKGMLCTARLTMKSLWWAIQKSSWQHIFLRFPFFLKQVSIDPDFLDIYGSKLCFSLFEMSCCTIPLPLLGPNLIFLFQLYFQVVRSFM